LEAVGQAIAYGMNTQIKTTPLIGLYVPSLFQGTWLTISCVTLGLMCAAVVPMFFLVNSTPNDIPADVIAAEIEARRMEEEFPEKEKMGGTQVREV
jgi:hypothetical protein